MIFEISHLTASTSSPRPAMLMPHGGLGGEQTRPKHLDTDRSSQPFAAVEGFAGQLDEALIRRGAMLVHELLDDALTLGSTPRTRM